MRIGKLLIRWGSPDPLRYIAQGSQPRVDPDDESVEAWIARWGIALRERDLVRSELAFLRERARDRSVAERVRGASSDALTEYALGWADEPSAWVYPFDESDLRACERTNELAPPHLRERMEPVLVKYRERIATRRST